MRAIRMEATGGPDVLRPVDMAEPALTAGTLLVDVELVGVNYVDTYFRSGVYQTELPWVPGAEAVGRVRAIGPEVSGFSLGDRVCWTGGAGAYAAVAVAPAAFTAVVPSELGDEAGLVLAQGLTAHFLACDTPHATEGAVALVHAAAGGVGSLLTQILVSRGVRVIATVSSEAKVSAARAAGAEDVVVYDGEDFVDPVRELTGGEGVEVVYDGVGRDTFAGSLRSLKRRGGLVLFGASSGAVDPVDPRTLMRAGSVTLQRPALTDYIAFRPEFERRAQDVFGWLRSGALRLTIGGRFQLDDAAEAHRALESRTTSGKLMLIVASDR